MSTIQEIRKLLDGTAQEGTTEEVGLSALVHIVPSSIQKDLVRSIVMEMPMAAVMRDFGAVVARVLGDELLIRGLSPSSYADLPEIPEMLASEIAKEMSRLPAEFVSSFLSHFRMKG